MSLHLFAAASNSDYAGVVVIGLVCAIAVIAWTYFRLAADRKLLHEPPPRLAYVGKLGPGIKDGNERAMDGYRRLYNRLGSGKADCKSGKTSICLTRRVARAPGATSATHTVLLHAHPDLAANVESDFSTSYPDGHLVLEQIGAGHKLPSGRKVAPDPLAVLRQRYLAHQD